MILNFFAGPSYVSTLKITSRYRVSKEISKEASLAPFWSQFEAIVWNRGS